MIVFECPARPPVSDEYVNGQQYQQYRVDDEGRRRQQEGVGYDDFDGAEVVLVGRFQQEGFHLEGVGAGRHITIEGHAVFAGIPPVLVVALEHILVVHTMLELVVHRGEAEGEVVVARRQLYALAGRHIVVVGAVQSRTLQHVVDEEVGDLQLQQCTVVGHQFLAVHDVVAVEGAEQDIAVAVADSATLRDSGLVDTVQMGEGGDDVLVRVERADGVLGRKPSVAALVEGDAADLVGGESALGVEGVEQPGAVFVFPDAVGDAAAVGAYPHHALVVAADAYDVVAHQHLVAGCWHLQLLDLHLLVFVRQEEDAVGGACPHMAFAVAGDGSHVQMGAFRIAWHAVAGIEEYGLAVFHLHHVHAAAVGGYPEVAVFVFDGLVGFVRAEALLVAFPMAVFLDVPAAAVGRHLEETAVFRADPVVALGAFRDAVEAAQRVSLRVVGDHALVAVVVFQEEAAALVAQQEQFALRVVEHCPEFVLHRRRGIGDRSYPDDVVAEDFQLVKSSAACGFPDDTLGQLQRRIDGVGEVPGV